MRDRGGHPVRRNHRILVFFLFLIYSAALIGCGEEHKAAADDAANAPAAAVVKVARGNIADNLEIASEFQPFQEVDVYAKVSGYIQKLYVDYGTHVKQGQILAVLEIPELQQQLQQDEASVRRSDQELTRAREDLNRAQSAYTVAHLTYTRLADVQKSRPELVAQEEIDVAKGKDMEADADVSSQKAALAAAEQALLAAKAALGKDQAMFDYARMTAPFDGVITQIYARTRARCFRRERFHEQGRFRALPPFAEQSSAPRDSCSRKGGSRYPDWPDPLPSTVSGVNRTFEGKIVRFSDQIDMTTRTMHTEVDVPNPKYELVPGMYASVKIPLHSAANVLTLPDSGGPSR